MNSNLSIKLQDGRILSYAEYGDSLGVPAFYFHGGQESRLSSMFMDSIAKELNVRIISPERPGVGLSSFQEDRTFLDWGKDVSELADSLSIDKFSVFGLSGGAPHVLACAYLIPNRLLNIAIISGATPYNYKGTLKGMWFPVKIVHWIAAKKDDKQLRKFIQKDYQSLLNKPEKRMKQFQSYLPKPDKELMRKIPKYGWEFIRGSLESYNQGIDGVVQEWKLYLTDWGFDLTGIRMPITLWYGEDDKMAPKNRGEYLCKEIPNAKLKTLKNEGHFSLIRNHLTEILTELKTN